MAASNRSVVDQRLAKVMSGPDKLWALLRSAGHTYTSFAKKHGMWPGHVRSTFHGDRLGADVREALTTELNLPREEIDRLLDEGRVVGADT